MKAQMMHLSETVRGNGGSHRGYPRLVPSQTRQPRLSRLRRKGRWTHLGSLCLLEAEFVGIGVQVWWMMTWMVLI